MRKLFVPILLVLFISYPVSAQMEITGAGASFPYPLYSKMFSEYHNKTGIKINYQSIGSGGGIRQLKAKTVDFAASDAFISDEQLKEFEGPVLHIPTCLGAVVIAYNLPGNPELKLSPDVIADIFLGKIKKWNDPRIASLNKGVKLPNQNITVVYRSDGSGTTFVFTDYLSKVSDEWKDKVGRGTSVNWPTGLGGKGNEGVTGLVKQTPGAIGYVELTYALQNNLPVASIKNKSGIYVKPNLKSISEASNVKLTDDMRISITNTDNEEGYPIAAFTYILVYKDLSLANSNMTLEKAKTLVQLLWWMTHEGQEYTSPLNYAPLSKEAVKNAEKLIKSINFKGQKLLD